jgi:hypothetical protein
MLQLESTKQFPLMSLNRFKAVYLLPGIIDKQLMEQV